MPEYKYGMWLLVMALSSINSNRKGEYYDVLSRVSDTFICICVINVNDSNCSIYIMGSIKRTIQGRKKERTMGQVKEIIDVIELYENLPQKHKDSVSAEMEEIKKIVGYNKETEHKKESEHEIKKESPPNCS